jgi:hypothetical protein
MPTDKLAYGRRLEGRVDMAIGESVLMNSYIYKRRQRYPLSGSFLAK